MSVSLATLRRTALRLSVAVLLGCVLLLPRTAPGTIAEQRARLPPPATCKHPVEGIWRSHTYNERYRMWTEFTLYVNVVEGRENQLEGKITNHLWKGGPELEQPNNCTGGQRYRTRIAMKARGTYVDGLIGFEGTRWEVDEIICGSLPFGWGYNLDNFTGKIDPALQEFQSVNNDGGRAVNEPTVFRRIGCLDKPPMPSRGKVKPPATYPPKLQPRGCGRD